MLVRAREDMGRGRSKMPQVSMPKLDMSGTPTQACSYTSSVKKVHTMGVLMTFLGRKGRG